MSCPQSIFQNVFDETYLTTWKCLDTTGIPPTNCVPNSLLLADFITREYAQPLGIKADESGGIQLKEIPKLINLIEKKFVVNSIAITDPYYLFEALLRQLKPGHITIILVINTSARTGHAINVINRNDQFIILDGQQQKYYTDHDSIRLFFQDYSLFYIFCGEQIGKRKADQSMYSNIPIRKVQNDFSIKRIRAGKTVKKNKKTKKYKRKSRKSRKMRII